MTTLLPELQLPGGCQELIWDCSAAFCLQGGLENLHVLADQLKEVFFSLTQPRGQLH